VNCSGSLLKQLEENMKLSLAVYPAKTDQSQTWDQLLESAKAHGFHEVFSSIHLPEYTLAQQVDELEKLNYYVKKHQLKLCVDLGGPHIKEILEDKKLTEKVRDIRIDCLRLDFGFTLSDLELIISKLEINSFALNASLYDEPGLRELINSINSIKTGLSLCACHNFYPRPHTGLDHRFFQEQNLICHRLNLSVTACVPFQHDQRGPLYAGLPTLEEHRNQKLPAVLYDMMTMLDENDGLLFADENCSEEDFSVIETLCIKKEIEFPVVLDDNITKQERQLLLNRKHTFRFDSNEWILRSESSRGMAQFATAIKERATRSLKRGDITIDNQLYQRYSGEIQFIRSDLQKDRRVNVLGSLREDHLFIIEQSFRKGFHYKFFEEK
jgi:hypothetical protein